jgi:non-ribosomal peptide synthetase component F
MLAEAIPASSNVYWHLVVAIWLIGYWGPAGTAVRPSSLPADVSEDMCWRVK